jgi:hypothetical protein
MGSIRVALQLGTKQKANWYPSTLGLFVNLDRDIHPVKDVPSVQKLESNLYRPRIAASNSDSASTLAAC